MARAGWKRLWMGVLWTILAWATGPAVVVDAPEKVFAESSDALEVYADVAAFAALGRPDTSYVEVYYMLSRRDLTFEQAGELLQALFQIETAFVDTEGAIRAQEITQKRAVVGDTDEAKEDRFLFMEDGFLLEPGTYALQIRAVDRTSGRVGGYVDTVHIRDFGGNELDLSDLELAVSIEPDTSSGSFVKHGRRVLPNPLRTYGLDMPMLYFYGEIYHLSPDEDTYTVRYTVLDHNGEVYKRFSPKHRAVPGASSVEVGGISVAAFPQGDYALRVEVLDRVGGRCVAAERTFQIWHLGPPPLTEQQAARFEQEVQYIASDRDLKLYRELDLRGKAEFIRLFWERRDPTPGTPENEAREEHYRRLLYIEQHFQEARRSGMNSDRGRIYLLYGAPDEIEQNNQSPEEKSYQVWHYYHIEGGVVFVFADIQGYGQYTLIHSTAREEMQDPDWRRWVRVAW